MHHSHAKAITVDDLPEPCRSCVFWEAAGPPAPEAPPSRRVSDRVAKESWWQATGLEWGTFALGVRHGDELLGYAVMTPASYLRGSASFGRVSDDALLLAVLWTSPSAQEPESIAASLVESAVSLAAARKFTAIEAFGTARGGPDCVPDERMLQACGFMRLHAASSYRHYRLDLRSTARWKEGVEEALAHVRRLLRRSRLGRVPSMPTSAR